MSTGRVTYGHVRTVLRQLGFEENRRPHGVALKHKSSDIAFLFRSYAETDPVTPAELFLVRKMLDEKGLLESESFDALLTKAPA